MWEGRGSESIVRHPQDTGLPNYGGSALEPAPGRELGPPSLGSIYCHSFGLARLPAVALVPSGDCMATKTLMNSGGTCQLITGKQEHGVTGHSLSPALPAVPGSQETEQEEAGAEGLLGIALSVSWEHGQEGSLSVVAVVMLGVFTAPNSLSRAQQAEQGSEIRLPEAQMCSYAVLVWKGSQCLWHRGRGCSRTGSKMSEWRFPRAEPTSN